MLSARRFLIAATLATLVGVACARSAGRSNASPPADPAFAAAQREAEPGLQCDRQRELTESADEESRRRDQVALVGRIEGADPLRDAEAAAARGDFRLVRAVTMIGTSALGVECRTPRSNRTQGSPLTLATRFYSDVPGSCETGGGRDPCRTETLLDAYGPAYNRAIVSNPLYPYGDLCRPAPGNPMAWQSFNSEDPADYGFTDLAPTDRPHDLHEAARRGTAAAVARMIGAAGRNAVDQPDPYGLTPLAWAVIRRRPDVAARLLAAGASPIGRACDEPGRAESPLRLALRTGQEAVARRMLTPAVRARVTPWPAGLFEAAARGGSASFLARMLREPHDGPPASYMSGSTLPRASEAVLEAFDRTLCWRAGAPRGARVRMIGVYESSAAPHSPSGHERGVIEIRMRASREPVFLVLTAYEPVDWRIELSRGARLAGIVALGMYRPFVSGDIAGVPVLINDERDSCDALGGAHLYAYEAGEAQQRVADAVERMLGVPVGGFQGGYGASSFNVD